jgi:hypothetical protein
MKQILALMFFALVLIGCKKDDVTSAARIYIFNSHDFTKRQPNKRITRCYNNPFV